jgi:DNA-binding transcriptional LysR family regulator
VASFVHSYPAVLIRINTPQNSEAVLDSVRRGESDVGFTAATSFPNDVRAEPAYELPLGIAVPSEHEFAGRNSISIDDLDGVSLVGPPHTTPQRQHVDALFFGSGLTPSYVAEADTQEMMLELVRAGVGVTFCPLVSASDGHKHRGGIVVLELKPASVATVMVLLSRGQQPTAAAIAFFEMACQAHRPII